MGADVKIAILSPASWGSSEQHRAYVSRWLVLAFQKSLGGSLMRISNSANAAFGFQGESEFETVVPRKNRTMIGMWELAAGGNITPFPQEGEPDPRELSPVAENTRGTETEAERVSERIRDDQSRSDQAEANSDRVGEGRFRTTEQNLESNLEEAESRSDTSRSSKTNSSLPTATEPLTQRTEETANSRQGGSSERRNSTRPQRKQRQPESVNEGQRQVPVPSVEDAPNSPSRHESNAVHEQEPNLPRVGNTRHPASPPAKRVSNVRVKTEPVAAQSKPTVPQQIKDLVLLEGWPEELGNSMLLRSRQSNPGFMVVVSWESVCPHADVNLYLAGDTVRRDVARDSNGGQRDRIEWAHSGSLAVDAWLNNFFTHREVTAKLSVIDLSTGTLLEGNQELGMRYDQGHHASWRGSSPAWKKIQLSSLDR